MSYVQQALKNALKATTANRHVCRARLCRLLADRGARARVAEDLAWICRHADAVYLLKGWEGSKGERAEKAAAEALGLMVIYQ